MTQPTSVDMTFDTSLVDINPPSNVNASFSTTDSGSTLDVQQNPTQDTIPTQAAYDQWASIYDTDGNMLQAIDDLELQQVLPEFLSQVKNSNVTKEKLHVLDLGCGTGRNTGKLVRYDWNGKSIEVTGLDFSQGMLNVATKKLATSIEGQEKVRLRLKCCDCFPTVNDPSTSPLPAVQNLEPSHAVISTLVLEHMV